MTTSDIIARFQLQVDDNSELSSDEELALANQVYREIANDRAWEWLKTEWTGTMSTSVPYITLPADFKMLSPNYSGDAYWWATLGTNVGNNSIIYVGDDYEVYRVINFANRREYRDYSNVAYIDVPNQRLVFTKQPTEAKSVSFDYIKRPATLTLGTSPLFNEAYHEVIAYWMAAKIDAMILINKNESYARENQGTYLSLLQQMQQEDAYLKLNQC